MASVVLVAVLVLCLRFPTRAQDVRPHQEYVDKGYCTYTYVVPPGSRTGSFSPPRLEEQLAETKEETAYLKDQVHLLTSMVQTLLGLQSDLTSRVDSLGAELELEQNLTRGLQQQDTRLQTQIQNLSDELSEEKAKNAQLEQDLTQELLAKEAKFLSMLENLSAQILDEANKNRGIALNLTQVELELDNLTTTVHEHSAIIIQDVKKLVPDEVISTLPSDAVSTAVAPMTRMTSSIELQPTSRYAESPAAEMTTTTQSGIVHTATEPTGSVIGMQLQVRLVGGSTLLEGRVEVRNGPGQWGSVCDDNFDLQDADTVCRQLGFGAAMEVKLAGHFGEGSGNVWLDEVACRGNETNLGDCPADSWGRSDCSHKEDVGVVCAGDAALRLVGSPVPWKGRLQIRPWAALEWGAVCNTSWTEAEAGFVCRQMGYTGGVTSSGQADIGEGSENIWLGDVTCSGDETNILSCGFSWEPSDCDHNQNIQLVCTGSVSVRLTGSQSPLQGRVEVRTRHGDWGTICDDGFDDRDAQVVCRQLGYRDGVATAGGDFREGTGNIWLQNVGCSGAESSVGDCQIKSWGNQDCNHSQDAGVVCTGDVSVRLTGGQSSSEGRVEVRPGNGDWGTVCDDEFDDRDAQVVCRQLGYYTGSARVGGVFPEGTGNIWLDNLNCEGNESSVADCEINRWGDHDCTHKEDAGVVCVAGEDCAKYHSSGWTTSGVYPIGLLPADVEAYCDMDTAGGGWTLIQRRQDGSVPFNRNWEEYKLGFGNKNREYWLGNENIHLLTNQKNYHLRIDLMDWNNEARYAEYSTFRVSGESDQYRLHISGYSGTAGDSMSGNNRQKFSTVDRDNDDAYRHCSHQYGGQGGWWFGDGCGLSFLNGGYLGSCGHSCPNAQGVIWDLWKGSRYSLKSVSMKIRS